MSDENQKLLDDCIGGQAFGWEKFVDRFLPRVSRIAEFTIEENRMDNDEADLKQNLIKYVFEQLAANNFRLLRDFDRKSELNTYVAVIAQRHANDFLAARTTD